MFGALGVVCCVGGGFVVARHDKKVSEGSYPNPNACVGGFIGMGLGMLFITAAIFRPIYKYDRLNEKINSEINGERICRVQEKIRAIEKALLEKPANIDEDQLFKVRDYFNLKLTEMMVDKTNNINIKVNRC